MTLEQFLAGCTYSVDANEIHKLLAIIRVQADALEKIISDNIYVTPQIEWRGYAREAQAQVRKVIEG